MSTRLNLQDINKQVQKEEIAKAKKELLKREQNKDKEVKK
jgi:hypothetical protein